MDIIITAAGRGQRFVEAGYADPKPLIRIEDTKSRRRIIDHVLDMTCEGDTVHFVGTKENLVGMREKVTGDFTHFGFTTIEPHSKGPVYTVLQALPDIEENCVVPDDEETMVIYCDGTVKLDREHFENFVSENDLDGCLITHTGFHPHTLSGTKMAYLRQDAGGQVVEVKEKASFTNDCMREHASSGMYYFKKWNYIEKYFNRLMETTPGFNGEYYVTLVYNLMIQDDLKVGLYDTDYVAILGTPETVKNFEAWAAILRGDQVRNEEDLLKCYRYWKAYHGV